MKSSIFYLGIALLTLSTSIAKNSFKRASLQEDFGNQIAQNETDLTVNQIFYTNTNSNKEEDVLFNPETVININSEKSIEEVIEENKKIIEETTTNESIYFVSEQSIEETIHQDNQIIEAENVTNIQPIFLEKTIDDTIQEDNAIIESTLTNIEYPLDFEKINIRNLKFKSNSKIIGMN